MNFNMFMFLNEVFARISAKLNGEFMNEKKLCLENTSSAGV